MITIATVGDFIREHYGLTAHCNACRHLKLVDFSTTARTRIA